MPNFDVRRGLIPVRHLDGSPYNGATNRYFVPATDTTALFVGDPVKSAGSADVNGVATVTLAAAGDALRGAIVGVEPITSESRIFREASTARYVYVADAPDLIFEIQEDAVGGALAAVDVGLNADLINAAGSTFTGFSGTQLDSSTKIATTAQVRIIGFVQRTDNEIGALAKMEVVINEHELKTTVGV